MTLHPNTPILDGNKSDFRCTNFKLTNREASFPVFCTQVVGQLLTVREPPTSFLSLCSLSAGSHPACLLASNARRREQGRGSSEKACMSLAIHVNICKPQRKSIAERRNSSNSVSVCTACLTAEVWAPVTQTHQHTEP